MKSINQNFNKFLNRINALFKRMKYLTLMIIIKNNKKIIIKKKYLIKIMRKIYKIMNSLKKMKIFAKKLMILFIHKK